MKRNYSLFQQYTAYVLLVNFFLQSCDNLKFPVIPITGEPATSIQAISLPTDIESLIGQELIAKGEDIVTCYQEAGTLKANLEMNIPQGF